MIPVCTESEMRSDVRDVMLSAQTFMYSVTIEYLTMEVQEGKAACECVCIKYNPA